LEKTGVEGFVETKGNDELGVTEKQRKGKKRPCFNYGSQKHWEWTRENKVWVEIITTPAEYGRPLKGRNSKSGRKERTSQVPKPPIAAKILGWVRVVPKVRNI